MALVDVDGNPIKATVDESKLPTVEEILKDPITKKFVFLTSEAYPNQTCIGLTSETDYHGVVYRYGEVTLTDESKLEANNNWNLKFKYDDDSELSFPNINTSKENLLILGASGVGKTTFLHLLSGLLKPLEGEIDLIGTPISKLTMSEMDRFRGKNIGIVFQKPHFINSLTVKENLQLAQYISKKIDKTRISSLLESLGIEDKANKKTLNLSQGEKQRVAIALAIVNSPKLILADEPTSSLDDLNCDKVINLLKNQAAKYKAKLIIITHDYRLKKHFKNTLSL